MKSKKQNEDARNRKDYLEGLRRFKKRGIPILIDGKICREAEWNRIFEVGEDGGFLWGKTEASIWETTSAQIKAV